MNYGRRRDFGPHRQLSARAPAGGGGQAEGDRNGPVDASRGGQTRSAGLRDAPGDTSDPPFLPSAAAANALLDARARAKRREEHTKVALDSLQYLRASDVCRLLRISKPTLWRLRRTRGFPEPTEVTGRLIAWRRSEVEEWLGRVASPRRLPVSAPTPGPPVTDNVATRNSVPTPATLSAPARRRPRKCSRPESSDEQLTLPFKSSS